MKWRSIPLQFSLRTLLVVLIPLAAVLALGVRSREPRIVRTGNPFDLAIEGPGYFGVTDKSSGVRRYTRGGPLRVDANGQLYLHLEGKECYLDPLVTIPADSGSLRETLKVMADGYVRMQSPGSDRMLGLISLNTFSAANLLQFEQPTFAADDETGPPIVWLPGAAPPGQILQGYRELRGWRWDWDSVVTLLIGFVLGVVATWLFRGPGVKTATASRAPSSESPSIP